MLLWLVMGIMREIMVNTEITYVKFTSVGTEFSLRILLHQDDFVIKVGEVELKIMM